MAGPRCLVPVAGPRCLVPVVGPRCLVPVAGPRCLVPVAGSKLLVACPLSRRGFFLAKKCVSGFLDLHFVRFVTYFVRFGQIWSDYPGSRIRIQAFSGLSSLPQGLFLANMCVSGFLDLHFVRFGQILSDFVAFYKHFFLLGVPAALRKPEKMHVRQLYKHFFLLGVPAALRKPQKMHVRQLYKHF